MAFENQPSLAAGEIGPELYGRVDQDLYYIGLRICRNFIVRQYGGASNRPGSRLVAESVDSTYKTRLIDFQFNEVQTYCLEFSNLTMRVVKNGGEVLETAFTRNLTGITQAAQGVFTSAAHGFANGNDVFLSGIVGMRELNGRTLRVSDQAANTFKLKDFQGNYLDTSALTAYVSGGTAARIYTVVTPWLSTDLFDLNYAQSADVLTIVHQNYPIKDITRTAHDAWTISDFQVAEGPFKDVNVGATTISPSAISGAGITLTASAAIFVAGDVGTLFYLEQMPTDTTKVWEVQKGVRSSELRRAGFNYYQAPTAAPTTKAITAITAAAPGIVTSAAHGFANGQVIYIDGIVGMTELNKLFYKVARATANTFSLQTLLGSDVPTTGFTAYVSGGTAETAYMTGTLKPDHTIGSSADGDPGVVWTYLHAGFGICKINSIGGGGTTANADVIKRLPDNLLTTASTNWAKAAWSSVEGYPAAVSYYKRRLWLGGPTLNPNRIDASRVGARTNFGVGQPILDDDALTLPLDTNKVNAIRHLISLKQMIVLTSSSEQLISGKDNLILATAPPSADVQGYNGSNKIRPIIIGNTAIFVEDTGDVVRSLQYDLTTDSFTGIDLTARSPHLFRNKTIVDWAYQKRPLAVIWTVMSDGALNGFTFMQEQKVYAWHRHDTDGTYESVCCIREGSETAAYKMVRRLVNGTYRRYLERDASRYFTTIEDAYFVDCGLTYDGRNLGATTIAVSGGTTWDNPEVLTLTANPALFVPGDVGDQITFVDPVAKQTYRLDISAYSSPTVVSAIPSKMLPVAYRNVARTDWRFGRKNFYNFTHLAGKNVSVLAEGNVLQGLAVTAAGKLTLPRAATVMHAGLPYMAEMETLDIAQPAGQGKAKSVSIPRLFITAQESRALFVATTAYGNTGQNIVDGIEDKLYADKFIEVKQRNPDIGYDPAIPAETSLFEVGTNNSWSNTGRIALRQPFPLPITINGITDEVPSGLS